MRQTPRLASSQAPAAKHAHEPIFDVSSSAGAAEEVVVAASPMLPPASQSKDAKDDNRVSILQQELQTSQQEQPLSLQEHGQEQGQQDQAKAGRDIIDRQPEHSPSMPAQHCTDAAQTSDRGASSSPRCQAIEFGTELLQGSMATASIELVNKSTVGTEVTCWLENLGASELPTPLLPPAVRQSHARGSLLQASA